MADLDDERLLQDPVLVRVEEIFHRSFLCLIKEKYERSIISTI